MPGKTKTGAEISKNTDKEIDKNKGTKPPPPPKPKKPQPQPPDKAPKPAKK